MKLKDYIDKINNNLLLLNKMYSFAIKKNYSNIEVVSMNHSCDYHFQTADLSILDSNDLIFDVINHNTEYFLIYEKIPDGQKLYFNKSFNKELLSECTVSITNFAQKVKKELLIKDILE
jgi:hypothetical protein